MVGLLTLIAVGGIILMGVGTMILVFRFGLQEDHDETEGKAEKSPSVASWNERADRADAQRTAASPQATGTADSDDAADEEAIKRRKREEALARKAARQQKTAETTG